MFIYIFEIFKCSGQNLTNSLCQFWNDKSVPLQIFHHSSFSWKITPLYFFNSNNINFFPKEPIKVKIFETCECSGQNLSNSLCQFCYENLIPLQILHHSSVSLNRTPLYFLSSNNLYFAQKEPIKVKLFEIFDCWSQNLKNSLCQFWNNNSIPLQTLNHSSVSLKTTPLYFLYSNNLCFAEKEPFKVKIIFRLLSDWVKICQIPHANFETTSQFLIKFCLIVHCYGTWLLCKF